MTSTPAITTNNNNNNNTNAVTNTQDLLKELVFACESSQELVQEELDKYRESIYATLHLRSNVVQLEKAMSSRVLSAKDVYTALCNNNKTVSKDEKKTTDFGLATCVNQMELITRQIRALDLVTTAIRQLDDANNQQQPPSVTASVPAPADTPATANAVD